eukprot:CCRYP_020053-RB/>CCRYP_020053-RB protein AED:0.08 eAED:0.08 QI:109/1/1/1/1/1/4/951/349
MTSKTPSNVLEAIKKLEASDQVTVQTYLAKLKSTIKDLEQQLTAARDGNDDDDHDGHAHYHGGERCTGNHDHGHDHHTEQADEVAAPAPSSCCEGHSHEHGHGHGHEHEHCHKAKDADDDLDKIPAWKKEAMNADPNACPFGGTWDTEASVDATTTQNNNTNQEEYPPMYTGDGSNDDYDKATEAKMEATDLKSQGKYLESLEKFNEAILAAEPSALLLANRAHVLFQLERYDASVRDCDVALEKNPDSAKALRIRGECHLKLAKYHAALKDLSAAQTIDFDEEAAVMLKEATEMCREIDAAMVKKKVEEEEKLKKRAAEVRGEKLCLAGVCMVIFSFMSKEFQSIVYL